LEHILGYLLTKHASVFGGYGSAAQNATGWRAGRREIVARLGNAIRALDPSGSQSFRGLYSMEAYIQWIHLRLPGITQAKDCDQLVYHLGQIGVSDPRQLKDDRTDHSKSFSRCEAHENSSFELEYVRRDGLTGVWKFCEPDRAGSARRR
jgi:hypothetical protein